MRIPFDIMKNTLNKVFLQKNFTSEKAEFLASVFTQSTLDGVQSHGINRVPLFIKYIDQGVIDVAAEATLSESSGLLERWDGRLGPGIINATKGTERAVRLAQKHGIGCVALRNTNHWMRGGTYGWQAADAGCIAICFTNTMPNMPPWGSREKRIGNNPFVVAVPRKKGHVVLDMAMSQFAYGKLHTYRMKSEKLPFPGGWNDKDELSDDPSEIYHTGRMLPIGYWKGSAMSMVLDMLVTILSAGNSTSKVGDQELETGISQVFICIDPRSFGDETLQQKLLDEIIAFNHAAAPLHPEDKVYYPGEKTLQNRKQNMTSGIPVEPDIWEKVLKLSENKGLEK